MPLPTIQHHDIHKALKALQINQGDSIYVCSFMGIFGSSHAILDLFVKTLLDTIGPTGTMIMPAFNWDYCHTGEINLDTAPSQVGVLTEHFRTHPNVQRTLSPPWNTFSVWGQDTPQILERKGETAFGETSLCGYFKEKNTRFVFLGCSLEDGAILVHHLEEIYQVPYRYWKDIRGTVHAQGKTWINQSRMYARNLDFDPKIYHKPFLQKFAEQGRVLSRPLRLGTVKSFLTSDYIYFMSPFLEKNPVCLLNRQGLCP